ETRATAPADAVPLALYQFFAEELFSGAPSDLRESLTSLALVPDLAKTHPHDVIDDPERVITEGVKCGFLSPRGDDLELHPLIREFLMSKLAQSGASEGRIRKSVVMCLEHDAWDNAFELIVRFALTDLLDELVTASFKSLVAIG